jgi:hypothetical protein
MFVAQAELCKNDYGDVLLNTSRVQLNRLIERIITLEGQVDCPTGNIEELKFVLNIIADIQVHLHDTWLTMN